MLCSVHNNTLHTVANTIKVTLIALFMAKSINRDCRLEMVSKLSIILTNTNALSS